MNNSNATNPLVSIGLPSYNRPDGLKRSLDQVRKQTYQNLEIIVSDNCSDDEISINAVVQPLMAIDKRIKYFRHDKNGGAEFNFRFLLEQATGEYFMWFADDDERHETCIDTCLQIIGDQGGAFGTFEIKNRYHKISHVHKVPTIASNMTLSKRLFKLIPHFPTVFIYGLYRTKCLNFFLQEKTLFDFFDGYFVMYVLIHYGFNVCPTKDSLFVLGVNEETYVPKSYKKQKNKVFEYYPVIKRCTGEIWSNRQVNVFNKIILITCFMGVMTKAYVTYEHAHQFLAKILNFTVRLPLRYLYRLSRKTLYGKDRNVVKNYE
jgi:glycosyltransferase involved in cell wall biosynthesis